MADKNKTFEEKLKELDAIVKKLEAGETTLNEMLELFENGVKIAHECSSELENAEKKVSILVKSDNGGDEEMELQPFGDEIEG